MSDSVKHRVSAAAATDAVTPSMWGESESARPIGDKLARPIEKRFLELALKGWRATNGAVRKALREQLKGIVDGTR